MRVLRPHTKWGRITLWSGGLSMLLGALRAGSASGSKLGGWATFVTLIFAFCASWLTFRWAREKVMWRLRHRLIVTYIFIGVIPIVLLLLMVGMAGYLFAGQFATYLALSDLQSASQHLGAANDALATQLFTLERSGKLDERIAGKLAAVSGENFPERTVTVWRGDNGFILYTDGTPLKVRPKKVPDVIKGDFSGFVMDDERLHLRAVKRYNDRKMRLTVTSDVPLTPELLGSATPRLGSVTLLPPDRRGDVQVPPPAIVGPAARRRVEAGRVPPPSSRFDPTVRFYTLFNIVDWENGATQTAAIGVATRPSILYGTLFATLGDNTKVLLYGVLGIATLFGLIELAALFVGIRLSRSMTRAVAELYSGTQHVNRGDLTHRIQVRKHDQLGALEQSFNSMSESLVTLVAEQKQKQRLESELAIAYEVQNLLFPHLITVDSLEIYGVCRPARSVSGDYYDFIPLGTDRLVLALGDISGKGISAALLMATVHAFVRAYSLEPEMVSATTGAGMYYRGGSTTVAQLSPAVLMTTLNYQLFRCTPPEKYATVFVACYDETLRQLTYCNAGHLPPIMLRGNGAVSRLEVSGTVVGLFEMRFIEKPRSRCIRGTSSWHSATALLSQRTRQANSARSG